jgi:hypothetical protein
MNTHIGLMAVLLAVLLTLTGAPRASAADTNTIQSIAKVTSAAGPAVDITLTSSRSFEVRNDILTMQIGTATFTLSRTPANGDTGTVIFTLTPAEFAATASGDPITVYYGSGSPSDGDAWQFGTLNKNLLK